MSEARHRKALEWAARRMKPGDTVGECPFVKSGSAIYMKDGAFQTCTCIEVPKTYADYLAQGTHHADMP